MLMAVVGWHDAGAGEGVGANNSAAAVARSGKKNHIVIKMKNKRLTRRVLHIFSSLRKSGRGLSIFAQQLCEVSEGF